MYDISVLLSAIGLWRACVNYSHYKYIISIGTRIPEHVGQYRVYTTRWDEFDEGQDESR